MQEMPDQPLRVLPLEYSSNEQPLSAVRPIRIYTIVTLIAGLVGWVVMLLITESVLIFGPILLLGGGVFLVYALRMRLAILIVLAGLHIGICLTLFCFVQMFHWGPRDAQIPFAIAGTIYIAAAITLSIKVLRRYRRDAVSPK